MLPYVAVCFLTYHRSRAGRPVVFNWSSIGIAANARYFQCGVLVINLRAWRNGKAAERAMDYLSEYWEQIQLADQGVLNAVLHDSWTPLDQRWNQTTTVLFPEYWTAPAYSLAEWKRVKNDPQIVHYDGGAKPWLQRTRHPRNGVFFTYLNKTRYRGSVREPVAARLERTIGFRNYYLFWRSYHLFRVALNSLFSGPKAQYLASVWRS